MSELSTIVSEDKYSESSFALFDLRATGYFSLKELDEPCLPL
jgi:hypothetical protein